MQVHGIKAITACAAADMNWRRLWLVLSRSMIERVKGRERKWSNVHFYATALIRHHTTHRSYATPCDWVVAPIIGRDDTQPTFTRK